MQTVTGVSLPLPGQAAESPEAAFGPAGQGAKAGLSFQPVKDQSQFVRLFVQGIARAEKAAAGFKADTTDAEHMHRAEAPENDGSFNDTSVISGLLTQLFAMQLSGPEDAPVTQTAASQELPAAACADIQNDDTLALPVMPQNIEAMTATSVMPQNAEAMTAAPVPYTEIPSAAPTVKQNEEGGKSKQAAVQGAGQTDAAVFQSHVAEQIVKTMQSMGDDEKTGQSFGALHSDEKKQASADPTREEGDGIAGLLKPGQSAGGDDIPDKIPAVEKAWNQFLNDFRAAEPGNSEIRIVLEPESLGVLTITVSHTESGISAKIRSEDRDVCAIMTGQIQKLIQSMESKGITVQDVDVEYGGMGQNFSFTQDNSGSRDGSSPGYAARPERNAEGLDDVGFFDLWQVPPGSGGDETSGTVEYRV